MIDIKARSKLAELIRHLVVGQMSNDDFDDAIPISDDKAIWAIFFHGPWHLYSDLYTHKLIGKHKILKKDKKTVSRWILFLKNQQEYIYPEQQFIDAILGLLTLGWWMKKVEQRFSQVGDLGYWPFENQKKFEDAKNNIGYLGHGKNDVGV